MYSKSENIETMLNDEADENINKPFDSLKNKHQNNVDSMKGGEVVFDYVPFLYYKCHKINHNRGGYILNPLKRK